MQIQFQKHGSKYPYSINVLF